MRRGKAVGGGFERKKGLLCVDVWGFMLEIWRGEKAGPRLRF